MVAHEIGLSHLSQQVCGRARRIVSEDSLCRVLALATTIHLLPQEQNLYVVGIRQRLVRQQLRGLREALKVVCLLTHKWKPAEERDDRRPDVGEAIYLPLPATVARLPHASACERTHKQVERSPIRLRHVEDR
jgi:hypothetical protein